MTNSRYVTLFLKASLYLLDDYSNISSRVQTYPLDSVTYLADGLCPLSSYSSLLLLCLLPSPGGNMNLVHVDCLLFDVLAVVKFTLSFRIMV